MYSSTARSQKEDDERACMYVKVQGEEREGRINNLGGTLASGNHPGLTGQENSSRGKRYITALRLIKADRSGGRKKREKKKPVCYVQRPKASHLVEGAVSL